MKTENVMIAAALFGVFLGMLIGGCTAPLTRKRTETRVEYREPYQCAEFTGPVNNPCGGAWGRTSVVAYRGSVWGNETVSCGFRDDGARCGVPMGCLVRKW